MIPFLVLWHYPFYDKIIGEVTLYTIMTMFQLIVPASLSIIWQQIGFQCSEWLSLSPDISPVEHARDELARRISARRQPPRNVDELTNTLIYIYISKKE